MNRFIIFLVIATTCFLNSFSKEIEIGYDDEAYFLTYKTLITAPGTVEIVSTRFNKAIDVLEIPSSIKIDDKEYTVIGVNGVDWIYSGSSDWGPKKLIFPNTIRSVRNSGASNHILEEVIFNDSPIEVMTGFSTYHKLKSISFGNAFKAKIIGGFWGCENLIELRIPDSVTEINGDFSGCVSLKKVTIPYTIEKFGYRYFADCSSLEVVEFSCNQDSKCYYVGEYAFINCPSLKSISLPAAYDIKSYAFMNCNSLTSVTINTQKNTEIKIGEHAFDNCVNLEDLQYEPSLLRSIGEAAFNNCRSLQSFTLSSDCSNIGARAFAGCSGIERFEVVGENGRVSAINGVLIKDPYQLIAYPVGKKDETYSIPKSVTSIASGAFEGAVHLEEIKMHDNVSDLGVMAFRDCKALKRVKLPTFIYHIPSGTFSGCSSLENINIPDGYEYIGKSAFQDCAALQEVKLPSELQVIGESAFLNCSKIENVELPAKVREIRSYTFRNCESLKTITLPENLDSIHIAALQDCKALQKIELPASLRGLEERAFKGCESLQSVIIPDNVTSVGINAFENCTSLKDVKVGNGVKEIGQWSFYDCKAMEKLTLGSSLESIGAEAFDGDVNIREITCLSVNPPSFPGGFPKEVMENATVTVPQGSEDAYNADPNWDSMVEGEVQKAESIELNYTEIDLQPKETITLVATVLPEDAVDKSVTWSSSDYYVVRVYEDGMVRAVDYGSALITATASNGVTATCRVTVKDKDIEVTSITLDPTSIELVVGETVQITATVLPEDATVKTLSWISSNKSVATVDQQGVVEVCGEGLAVITACSTDGTDIFAECNVNGVASVGSLFMDGDSIDIYNIDGTLVRKDVDAGYVDDLPSGVYIIRSGGKVMKIVR